MKDNVPHEETLVDLIETAIWENPHITRENRGKSGCECQNHSIVYSRGHKATVAYDHSSRRQILGTILACYLIK